MIARTTHKRYANYEQYQGICEDGTSTGIFIVNEKTEEAKLQELKSFMELSGAVRMFKVWTAHGGKCHEEVVVI